MNMMGQGKGAGGWVMMEEKEEGRRGIETVANESKYLNLLLSRNMTMVTWMQLCNTRRMSSHAAQRGTQCVVRGLVRCWEYRVDRVQVDQPTHGRKPVRRISAAR